MFSFQEKILLHRVRRGDQIAFAKLYNNYLEEIRRFIIFKISQPTLAEELTNSVFIKALNYLLAGHQIENFRAFLYQTARNLVIDFYRSQREEISLDEAAEIPFSPDYQQQLDQKMAIEEIKKHLSFLKPAHQEIILLRFFEGLSFSAIAQITGQKEATVRMIAHRGLKELKERLKQTQNH